MLLPLCAGVDLNRNFGYRWGGVSLDPRRGTSLLCLETYMGSKPFSEAESNAIRNFIQSKPAGTFEVRNRTWIYTINQCFDSFLIIKVFLRS